MQLTFPAYGVTILGDFVEDGKDVRGTLRAQVPGGELTIHCKTSMQVLRAILSKGEARFAPSLAAFVNRVRGLYNLAPLASRAASHAVDLASDSQPFANATGVGDSVSAGQWSYGPYSMIVPVLRPSPYAALRTQRFPDEFRNAPASIGQAPGMASVGGCGSCGGGRNVFGIRPARFAAPIPLATPMMNIQMMPGVPSSYGYAFPFAYPSR